MPIISASVDAFLVAATAVLLPSFYYMRRDSQRPPSEAPYRTYLSFLLVAHTIYILYVLLVLWPPNLFSRLHVALNAPPEVLRTALLRSANLTSDSALPTPLVGLLTRLSSFDMRALYVRFGHTVVQECEHCNTFDEYALFVLPRALREYLREAVLVGLLTMTGSMHERWRIYAMGALVAAAVAEGYFILTSSIQIPKDGQGAFMWHDNAWLLRQVLFLLLPVIVHLLPPTRYPPPPSVGVAAASITIQQAIRRVHSLRFTRAAVMRDPTLRAAAAEWWDRQRVEGEWAREDESVRRMANKLGKGFDEGGEDEEEGKLRVAARQVANAIKADFVPAHH